MILELDCGNTRIKWRLEDRSLSGSVTWAELLQYEGLHPFPLLPVTRVRVGSVASVERNTLLKRVLSDCYGAAIEFAQVVSGCAGVVCGYLEPARLGVDRWLAVVAAVGLHPGKNLVIIDAGSALTLDIVLNGVHQGGFIGPGLHMMRDALYAGTAAVQVPELMAAVPQKPGVSTVLAVSGALHLMMLGLIEQARARFAQDALLVMTGGDGPCLLPSLPGALYVPDLVLDGLAIALP